MHELISSSASAAVPALAERVYYDDPRLRMTVAGRLTVRVVGYVVYLFLTALAFTLIFSEERWMFWAGFLLALFLVDRLLHRRSGDWSLTEFPSHGRVNAGAFLTPAATTALERAFDRSGIARTDFFLEMVLQLSGLGEIRAGLRRLDVKVEEFKQKMEELLKQSAAVNQQNLVTDKTARIARAEELVMLGLDQAVTGHHEFIEAHDLFSALARVPDEWLERLFNLFAIRTEDMHRALIIGAGRHGFFARARRMRFLKSVAPRRTRHKIMNRAWTSRPTPVLDAHGTDLTDIARQGQIGFLVGHRAEYGRLADTLARPVHPNALLVGEPGVGKETLVAHLADMLVDDKVAEALFDKRLVMLEVGSVMASAGTEEAAAHIRDIAGEIVAAGNIILYIPDIHNLVKGGDAFLSAADALLPIITNDSFPVIGATYPREFKEFIEARSDFSGAFEVIRVEEISPDETEELLSHDAAALERETGMVISFGAVRRAAELAHRYLRAKPLPQSAEELLKETMANAARRGQKFVGPAEVTKTAQEKTNVPLREAGGQEAQALLALEETLHQRVIGQEEAVSSVARALREYRSGLGRGKGPIASFLFVGPTGVGKTELAKALAVVQFGAEENMVRFDMSEYKDKQSFFRLIGSPDGAVSGQLTEAILHKPYSLVLLDEFEKAYPEILDLFLQVLDDGRLTDNLERTVDFRDTIIIATSNSHSDIIMDALKHGTAMVDIAEYLKQKLADAFKPELLNRFSRVIVFRDLSPEDLLKITRLNLVELTRTLAAQGITATFDQAAVERVMRLGYDPTYGARPLRRVIEEKLRGPLAEKILRREITRGSSVQFTVTGDEFVITVVEK